MLASLIEHSLRKILRLHVQSADYQLCDEEADCLLFGHQADSMVYHKTAVLEQTQEELVPVGTVMAALHLQSVIPAVTNQEWQLLSLLHPL